MWITSKGLTRERLTIIPKITHNHKSNKATLITNTKKIMISMWDEGWIFLGLNPLRMILIFKKAFLCLS